MSTSTIAITSLNRSDRRTASLPRTTVAVGAVAAAVTTGVAAALHAAGVHLSAGGEIPLAAFAQFSFIGAVFGGMILASVNRRSAIPGRRFVQIVAALTAVSCVPSIALGSGVGSKTALVATHLVAAAIIVPVLARRAAAA